MATRPSVRSQKRKARETGAPRAVPEELSARVNRELYKRNAELAVRNKTLALLRKLDEVSMGLLGMSDMTEEMTSAIAMELGFELVSVAIVDEERKHLRWVGYASPAAPVRVLLKGFSPSALSIPLQQRDSACVQALRRTTPLVVNGVRTVFPVPLARVLAPHERADASPRLVSSLVHPLRLGTRPLGVLTVSASRDLSDLSSYEYESLSGIMGLVAIALEKARMYQELQETSANLRVANTQLAQLDKAKSEFLSIASHQLYSPLTSLKGYLSMIQEGVYGAVSEKLWPIHLNLRESTDRLIDLIRNLLDVSRIESGRLEISPELIDVVDMTRGLVTELAPSAQRKHLSLTFREPAGKIPRVVGDAQRLRQVFLNTLDNAIKYTGRGRVDVRITAGDGSVLYIVEDTGKGMSAGDLQRIFGKFTRVGGADRYHAEGSGLGLYVARLVVREHRGDIWAESAGEGKGSTFTVKLPAEGSPEALKVGQNVVVGIQAAAPGERPDGDTVRKPSRRPAIRPPGPGVSVRGGVPRRFSPLPTGDRTQAGGGRR